MASKPTQGSDKQVHLAVIHHGLWGAPAHLSYLATTLAEHHGGQLSPNSSEPQNGNAGGSRHQGSYSGPRLVVLNASANATHHESDKNKGTYSYDGIDWCGERLIDEIYTEVKRIESEGGIVARFSIIGYSLGGLIARYTVGVLHLSGFFGPASRSGQASASGSGSSSPSRLTSATTTNDGDLSRRSRSPSGQAASPEKVNRQLTFKSRPLPASFTTFATPNLGMPPREGGGGRFGKWMDSVGASSLGRTGTQLYMKDTAWSRDNVDAQARAGPGHSDKAEDGETVVGLIEAMSEPSSAFIRGLASFERVDFYANAVADRTVPFRSAAVESHDPFVLPEGLILTRDKEHPSLLVSYRATPERPAKPTTWESIRKGWNSSPISIFVNPKRYPFPFPLNYIFVLFLPVMLPGFLGYVVHVLRTHSKQSDKRVEAFERAWAEQNGLLDGHDGDGKLGSDAKVGRDAHGWSKIERHRISAFLSALEGEVGETIREVGEDNLHTDAPSGGGAPRLTRAQSTMDGHISSTKGTLALSTSYHLSEGEQPLSPAQQRIVARLNDKAVLPRLRKYLAHYEGLDNTHAVIIVRDRTVEAHRMGMDTVQSWVERFAV